MRAVLLILALAAGAVGCSSGGPAQPSEGLQATTSFPASPRTTEGSGATFPFPTTTIATTTTIPPLGFPDEFPVTADGTLFLSGDSTLSQSLTIYGESPQAVLDYFTGGLQAAGYQVAQPSIGSQAPFSGSVNFAGSGSSGTVQIEETAEGAVDVNILQGTPGLG